ncbi:hypothetical protein CPB85DRAFT_1261441 [Mucidula mucida]|nr:hypothetical protein CPB85DRAFT_1261441 [Mucidula mucida]
MLTSPTTQRMAKARQRTQCLGTPNITNAAGQKCFLTASAVDPSSGKKAKAAVKSDGQPQDNTAFQYNRYTANQEDNSAEQKAPCIKIKCGQITNTYSANSGIVMLEEATDPFMGVLAARITNFRSKFATASDKAICDAINKNTEVLNSEASIKEWVTFMRTLIDGPDGVKTAPHQWKE